MKSYIFLIFTLVVMLSFNTLADDTDIYKKTSAQLNPNILIIFDSSGSMEDEVKSKYDKDVIYPSGVDEDSILYYRYFWRKSNRFSSIDDMETVCNDVWNELIEKGYASNVSCGGYEYSRIRIGNYDNYVNNCTNCSLGKKIDIAKEAVLNLIETTDNANFGIMVFNASDGGKIIVECASTSDDHKQKLKNAIQSIDADGGTPLAESLAEAGLYFAGLEHYFASSIYNTDDPWIDSADSKNYKSPIEYECQNNYVILMTDGMSSADISELLYTNNAYMGKTINDYDNDSYGSEYYNSRRPWDSNFLDDVAKFLYDEDIRINYGSNDHKKQNIRTFTIGFDIDNVNSVDKLLVETALHGNGIDFSDIINNASYSEDAKLLAMKVRASGENSDEKQVYFTTNSASELEEAFESIVSDISKLDTTFIAPVVPVSRMNRTFAGDRIYLAFFKPQADGKWHGNIKKYGINPDTGDMYDANDNAVTDFTGEIQNTVSSFWSFVTDGPLVEKGGAGSHIGNLNSDRNIYTYTGVETDLTDVLNNFDTGTDFSKSPGGDVSLNTYLDKDLIDTIRGETAPDMAGAFRSGEDEWILGDFIHSAPAVVHYSNDRIDTTDKETNCDINKTLIFAGSNDGMLHCFNDCDGDERWAFISPRHLNRLKQITNDDDHDYFLDGSPVTYSYDHDNDENTDDRRILLTGERRGGRNYFALDISDPDIPEWLYEFGPERINDINGIKGYGAGAAFLGQSWTKPKICTIMKNSSQSEDIFLIAGGYDINNDYDVTDNTEKCPTDNDEYGRSVYSVNVESGNPGSLMFNNNGANSAVIKHCIVDVVGIDRNGDGITTRAYAGDLGGNVYFFSDDIEISAGIVTDKAPNGQWGITKLFSAPDENYVCQYGGIDTNIKLRKKLFYAPDATGESFYVEVMQNGETKWDISKGEFVFFGTGNRANPNEKLVENSIYAVKNKLNKKILVNGPLDESDLIDVTDNTIQMGNKNQIKEEREKLDCVDNYGWFIKLDENTGEQVVSSPVVFGGVVYITTYTPPTDLNLVVDPCSTGADTGRGVGRLYALDYKTGGAVHDFSKEYKMDSEGNYLDIDGKITTNPAKYVLVDSTKADFRTNSSGSQYYDENGEITSDEEEARIKGRGKKDRILVIGSSIPSAPVIAIFESGPALFVGIEGGILKIEANEKQDLNEYYWRQITDQ